MHEGETFDGDYGVDTALHIRYPYVWQQDSGSALRSTLIRRSRTPSTQAIEAVATQLGLSTCGSPRAIQAAIADEIDRIYEQHGMPTRVSQLNVSKEDFEAIARHSLKIFNSNAGLRDGDAHMKGAIALLEAAY